MLVAQVLLYNVYYVPVFVVMGLLPWSSYLRLARLKLNRSLCHIAPDVSREGADKSVRLRRWRIWHLSCGSLGDLQHL